MPAPVVRGLVETDYTVARNFALRGDSFGTGVGSRRDAKDTMLSESIASRRQRGDSFAGLLRQFQRRRRADIESIRALMVARFMIQNLTPNSAARKRWAAGCLWCNEY